MTVDPWTLARQFARSLAAAGRAWVHELRSQLSSVEGRTAMLAFVVLLVGYLVMLWPMLSDFSTYGFHDWDAHSAYRQITVVNLKEYGEGPWWHPWLCGGVPGWGYVEGASNLVSPYLPFYLLTDIRTALRVEVLGDGLLGLLGAYLLARRVGGTATLSAFFSALYVLNGRWALQTAVGHTWHLQYALTPWVFYFFERHRSDANEKALRHAVIAGVLLSYMCYAGAIYPLPQTALFLGAYAVFTAIAERKWWPLRHVVVAGVVALGLSAPKLFAVMDYMRHAPRLIESNERIGLAELLVMLADPHQAYGTFPVRVPAYNWHEWGIYVGLGGLGALGVAFLFAGGKRGQVLKICAVLCLLLGFGRFHEDAPWSLLHQLPPFSSQHVPSRFHYLMLFFGGLAFVETASRWLSPKLSQRPALELVLLVPLALFVRDLVTVNQLPFAQAFWMRAPSSIERAEQFEHLTDAPVSYLRADWAAPMLLAMFANTGVIRCYGADPSLVPGADAADAPGYRGRAFILRGPGEAQVVQWTPNRAVVRVSGAEPGALVVYNMNYDKSWSANGAPALEFEGKVAARLRAGERQVSFSYFPRTLKFSVPICLLTLGLIGYFGRAARRRKSIQSGGRAV